MGKQFTTTHVLHDHVQIVLILKRSVQFYAKGMVDQLKHIFFIGNVFNLLQTNYIMLTQYFHGKVAARLLVFAQFDSAKRARSCLYD